MDLFYKIISILISLSIFGNAYVIKRIIGTWLFPGCLFSLFWFCYTFFPLVILFEVPVNPLSMLYIFIATVVFSWSSIYFNWEQAFQTNKKKEPSSIVYDTRFLKKTLNYSVVLAIIFTVLQVNAQGIKIADIFIHPLQTAGKYTSLKYTDKLNSSKFYILSLLFSYISVLVGGLLFGSRIIKKEKRKTLICFIPALAVMFSQGAKGLFFLSLFLFLGSLMATNFNDGKINLLNYKNNIRVLKFSIFSILILSFSFFSRGLYNRDISYAFFKIRMYLTSYAFTHMYGFSDWFSAYIGNNASQRYDVSNNYFGYYTLRAFTKYLPHNRPDIKGIYSEYFKYEDLIKSNIYTMYRGLIMDFSIIGSLIFIFINGLILNVIFYSFLKAKKPIFSLAVMSFMIGYFYITYIISLLTWNITILSFILFIFILTINKYKFVISKNDNI